MEKLAKFTILLSILGLSSPALASSSTAFTATCTNIKGSQLNYLADKTSQNNYSYFGITDIIISSGFTVVINGNSAVFTDNSKTTTTATLSQISNQNNQLVFSGLINNNPMLLTLYPNSSTGIYTIQAPWGKDNMGISATTVYAKCAIPQK